MNLGKLLPVLFLLLFVAVLGVGYAYFFVLSPSFIEKPELEFPEIIENESFSEEQIFYVLNEIDAYKLHNDPFNDEPPIIEFIIEKENLLVVVEDNKFESLEQGIPDLRIYSTKEDLYGLLQGNDFEKSLLDKYNKGDIDIEIVADEATLALKGYKAIYDKISSSDKITGNVVKLNPANYTNGLNISLLFFIALILELILRKI